MREAMYGWMTRWLKNEGKGQPIPEPRHEIDKPEDLSCFPDGKRPAGFMLPPLFSGSVGQRLVEQASKLAPDHIENWESTAAAKRNQLRRQVFGDFPPTPEPAAKLGKMSSEGTLRTTPVIVRPEPDMPVPALLQSRAATKMSPPCILLHLDGKEQALKHPLAAALLDQGWTILAPDLRATGETRPANDSVRDAPDHNSAEHALWVGRPLLGQWVFDVACLCDWLGLQPGLDRRRLAVVGLGQAGLVALCAAALFEDRIASAGALGLRATLVTHEPYPGGTRMGLLAPGILQVGDIPHLAALGAPHKLLIADGLAADNKPLAAKALRDAYAFTTSIYRLHKQTERLSIIAGAEPKRLVQAL